jgi:hypothetical protein
LAHAKILLVGWGKILSNQPNFNGSGKTRALPSGMLLNDILLRKNSYK